MRRLRLLSLLLILVFVAATIAPSLAARAQSLTGTVAVDALNVRKAPRTSYPVIGTLSRGDTITLVGRNTGGTWLEAQTPFGLGWVSAQYILASGEIGSLPITDGDISAFATIVAFPAVYVRSGPSLQFPTIGLLYTGQVVDIIGQDPTSTWLQVVTPFGDGWIESRFASVTGNLFAQPNTDQNAQPVVRNVNYRLRVRAEPNTDSDVVGIMSYNQFANIIGVSPDYRWWKVTGPFGTGWVDASFVLAIGNLNSVPVVSQ